MVPLLRDGIDPALRQDPWRRDASRRISVPSRYSLTQHAARLWFAGKSAPQCYTTPADIEDARNLAGLGDFCRRMGRDARQGEVGLVVGDEDFAIRDFAEE